MLELVKERYGAEDEVELVIAWLRDLAATKTFGSREPNVLGSDALTEDHFQVLDALLRHGMVELQNARVDEIISDLKAVPLLTAIIDASQAV